MKRTSNLDDLVDEVGAKPSTKGKTDKTKPKTVSTSTQTDEQANPAPEGTDDGDSAAEANTGAKSVMSTEPGPHDGNNTDITQWGNALNEAAERINALPPQMRAIVLGSQPAEPEPMKLSSRAKARLRHHVRSAAGRLAAAIKDEADARTAWELEVSEARRQGYPEGQILGQALDAELDASDVPPNPSN